MRVFDTSFDYKTDTPSKTKPDTDQDSQKLRADHELLWTKELPSGDFFAPKVTARRSEYLIFTDASGKRHCYGSDAITSSYTGRSRPATLVNAMAGLDEGQRSVYLDPPYTIGSAMIWPVRAEDSPTMNQARGFGRTGQLIGDRMDLTLECIRRHYAGESENPPSGAFKDAYADFFAVINAYADFFALFGQGEQGFRAFVDFFHLQDLVTPDYKEVRFYLDFDNFESSGIPATTRDYVTYRNATLEFIAGRKRRMAEWVTKNHPEIEVHCPWWQPPQATDDMAGGVSLP
ncbi:DUF6994 family protein [Arthrobacter sp. R-11]|uniref:DUF6994 family protein n=1 Tax=Arthrobacter sp. R-11 TaxID=3404053 RepID=UPI003CF65685